MVSLCLSSTIYKEFIIRNSVVCLSLVPMLFNGMDCMYTKGRFGRKITQCWSMITDEQSGSFLTRYPRVPGSIPDGTRTFWLIWIFIGIRWHWSDPVFRIIYTDHVEEIDFRRRFHPYSISLSPFFHGQVGLLAWCPLSKPTW